MALRARILAVPLVVLSPLVAGAVDASANRAPVATAPQFRSFSRPRPRPWVRPSRSRRRPSRHPVPPSRTSHGISTGWASSTTSTAPRPRGHFRSLARTPSACGSGRRKGKEGVATREVIVAAPAPPPPPPPAPGSPPPSGSSPLMLKPFPVVRIAGTVLPRGALVHILSVRAPLGARIRVRCSGTACPLASVARTSTTRVMRLRRFERRLPQGPGCASSSGSGTGSASTRVSRSVPELRRGAWISAFTRVVRDRLPAPSPPPARRDDGTTHSCFSSGLHLRPLIG